MTPKKAIVIVLILFLIFAAVFAVLYVNKKQKADLKNTDTAADQEKNQTANPENPVSSKINKIIEDAEKNPETSPEAVRQEVISTINAEIMKQEENKTPEQKAADLKAQEERQKIIDRINSQIK